MTGALVPGQGPARTGVTAILPHGGNLFREKVPAASHVINGFGKSIGLVQVDELGTIETPILLTNTLNIPRVADALIDHMLTVEPRIGIRTSSVNPVVMECNDGHLNDIQGRHVRAEHVQRALAEAADGPVAEGSVGAGTGMIAFGVNGGIGTASRVLPAPHPRYTVGALVLANTGRLDDLRIDGVPVGRELAATRGEWADGAGRREHHHRARHRRADDDAATAPPRPACRARPRQDGRDGKPRQRRHRPDLQHARREPHPASARAARCARSRRSPRTAR